MTGSDIHSTIGNASRHRSLSFQNHVVGKNPNR